MSRWKTRTRLLVAVTAVAATATALATQAGAASVHRTDVARGGTVRQPAPYNSDVPLQVANGTARLLGAVDPSQKLRVTVGITASAAKVKAIARFDAAVQNRKSPLFHKYLTAKQWNARFTPTSATQAKVVHWVKSTGLTVTHLYPDHLLVDAEGTAAQLEAAFHVSLNRYSLHGKTFFSNNRNPVVPKSIRPMVGTVGGLNNVASLTTSMPAKLLAKQKTYAPGPVVQSGAAAHANGSMKALRAAEKPKAHPNITGGSYDPTDIYSSQAYDENALHNQSSCCNPTNISGSSGPTTSIAIATVGSQQVSDMQGFQARYSYLAYDFNEINIGGTPSCCDGEGTMDLEWSTALSNSFGSFANTAHVWLYDGVNAQISTFDSIYNQMLTDGHAKIVSSSWGCAEDTCYTGSEMDFDHNNIFNAMIGQGYTLLNASDDHGAYADCTSTKRVQYPASDPDFLAISATNLALDSSSNFVSEGAWQGNSAGCANNGGGGGGGCSDHFAAPSYQLSPSNPNYFCGTANGFSQNFKTVPDVSLNGDWLNSPQNLYFEGGFQGNGGTSIAAPEMAGFYAQQNSYGLSLANVCGSGSSACAPIGQGGVQLYLAGVDHAAQGKNPYYDTTSGCTTNDAGPGFCGITGYDRATGWGTVNMLQLAWANNYWNMGEASPPTETFSGAPANTWVNGGTVGWNLVDNGSPAPSGVSGWTAQWGSDPGDPSTEAHGGSGNSFYSGPLSAHGSTSGSTGVNSDGEGCHTLFVRGWDNIGESSVNSGTYCFDDIPPTAPGAGIAQFVTGTQMSSTSIPVQVTWGASTDSLSGVAEYLLWESVDGGAYSEIATPASPNYTVNLAPGHTYQFAIGVFDNAGNFNGYTFNPAFKLAKYQENNAAITYTGTWHSVANAQAANGHLENTTQKNATATFAFSGRAVAWVGALDPTLGSASTSLDGKTPAGVSEHGSSSVYQDIVYAKAMTSGKHTVAISNNATAGHPGTDVDAFLVISKA
jgi:hypothetical protein